MSWDSLALAARAPSSSTSRRKARASSSPARRDLGRFPGVVALPHCQSSGPVPSQVLFPICIIVPSAPGGPGTKVPSRSRFGQGAEDAPSEHGQRPAGEKQSLARGREGLGGSLPPVVRRPGSPARVPVRGRGQGRQHRLPRHTLRDMEGIRHSVTSADGVRIGLLTAGSGPGLLLVHGGMGTIESWRRVWGALTAHRRVTAIDRRGRGSSGDAGRYELSNEYADVAAVAAAIAGGQGGPVDVTGHSIGATCVLGAAALGAPFRRIVLHEPPGPQATQHNWPERVSTMVADGQMTVRCGGITGRRGWCRCLHRVVHSRIVAADAAGHGLRTSA